MGKQTREIEDSIAFGVSAKIVRKGLTKIPVVSITDGYSTWDLGVADSFTITELKQRFPYFFKVGEDT